MPEPRLIHPINVTLEIINRDESVFDPYAREPVGQVIREGESENTGERVIVKAQVSFYFSSAKMDEPIYDRGGVIEESLGYIVVRYNDLIRSGLLALNANNQFENMKIKRGDRIIQFGKEIVDYYVTGFKPFAHYPKQQQTLLQINFIDRHPGYQQGDL